MAEERIKVIWANSAVEDYKKIVAYLLEEWSIKTAESFVEIVKLRIDRLSSQPFIGRLSDKDNITRSVIAGRYNRLYYEINEKYIKIIGFFDMRQYPSKNKFEK